MLNIFNKFPEIELGEIILRQLQKKDATVYLGYLHRPEMLEFFTDDNMPRNLSMAQSEIAYWRNLFSEKTSIYWAIALRKNNQLIGTAGFNMININYQSADISYDLDYNFWGRGIMSRVIEQIIIFAEEKLALTKIRATCAVHNLKSIRLLEKHNFQQKKLLPNYEIIQKKPRDYFLYIREI